MLKSGRFDLRSTQQEPPLQVVLGFNMAVELVDANSKRTLASETFSAC